MNTEKITMGFKVTKAEADEIDDMIDLSGMKKQDYILQRLKNETLNLTINPCIYLQLKTRLERILSELKRLQYETDLSESLEKSLNRILTLLENSRVSEN